MHTSAYKALGRAVKRSSRRQGALAPTLGNEKCEQELQKFYRNLGDNEMLDCIDSSAAKSIRDTIKAHSKYWECLGGISKKMEV